MRTVRDGAPAAKVLVIGLDSADRRLVEQWSRSGGLPVLQSLRERGAYGQIEGPPGLGDDAVWASFYTGVAPGRHGRFFWRKLERGTYEAPQFRDQDLPREPFWNTLCRAGRRVAIIDVPKSPLSTGLNGIQVADWLVHGRDHPETCSWPPELAAKLLERFGDDMTDRPDSGWLCRLHSLKHDEYDTLLGHLRNGLSKKTQAVVELLKQGEWDLFLVVFKEAHCVGHQFWHLLESGGGDPIRQIYQALDGAVGQLLEVVGSDTHVIVFSDLGMGKNVTGEHLLDQVLLRLERKLAKPGQRLQRIQQAMRSWRRTAQPDPRAKRLAYQVEHNEISGAIRINLVGREPAGKIHPGREFQEFCGMLSRQLLDLKNQNGEPIVEAVLPTSEVYPGDRRDSLPDLFVVWNRHARINGVQSPSLGWLDVPDPGYRTGNHVPGGFYLSVGPDVQPGEQRARASIVDLAPTIAQLLHAPLGDQDGSPIPALCRSPANLSPIKAHCTS